MACGLPAIATDAPPMNEFVKDGYNGLLVKVANRLTRHDNIAFPEEIVDIAELTFKMDYLINNPGLVYKMQINARNSINNYNTFGKKVNEIIFQSSKLPISRDNKLRNREFLLTANSLYPEGITMNYKELMAEASRMSDSGNLEEAIAICHKAINMDIQEPDAYYEQALLYRRLGELDHAISRFEHVTKLNSGDASVFNNLGVLLLRSGTLA